MNLNLNLNLNLKDQTRQLVIKEKHYTALVLKNLAIIQRQKLFSDYGYPSLFKYLICELGYSESEANIRVAAVKLSLRDASIPSKITRGKLSLTNAAQVNTSLSLLEKDQGRKANAEVIQKAVGLALDKSTRNAKEDLRVNLKLRPPRRETLILDDRILGKIDRVRKIYGDMSAYELLDILLEEKLKSPKTPLRNISLAPKNSRYIPVQVKHAVHKGECIKCHTRRNLQYDHKLEYALGGTNGAKNIQILCANCNQRKRIKILGLKY